MANNNFVGESALQKLISLIKSTFMKKEDVIGTSTIDIDTTPTEDSNNLVTSGGVYDSIDDKLDKESLLHKQITITYIDGTTVSEDVAVWKPQN